MALGHLGINRENMPRVKRRHTEAFLQFLNANRIGWRPAKVHPCEIEDVQADLDPEKIRRVAERCRSDPDYAARKLKPPLFMSRDGYLLDGHHRLAVHMLIAPNAPVLVAIVDLPIRELLRLASYFDPED